jgi:drug/metabolite transporter (DMT)-like permease
MVLAAALLAEHLTIMFVAGFGAVLMGVVLVNWPKRAQTASANRSR